MSYTNDALVEGNAEATDQLVARVLSRAHLTAIALDEPDEARAILHMAESFADELASTDPRFDRTQFIQSVTEIES